MSVPGRSLARFSVRFCGPLIVAIAAIAIAAEAHASTLVDTVLTMSDGVRLNVAYYLPEGAAPQGGRPAILTIHGFAGTKRSNAARALLLADSGYFVAAYSVRGQGRGGDRGLESEGTFNWFTGERELEDVRELLAWMAGRADVRDDRIAVEGISQGGLMTWGAAVGKLPIRCAVPIAAVPDYLNAFAHGGCNNYFAQVILTLARQGDLVAMGPFLNDVLAAYEQDRHEDLLALLAQRDLMDDLNEIDVPVFAQLAWHDEIFNPGSLYRAFRAIDAPTKILLVPGAHGGVAQRFASYMNEQTLRFYRRWLRDDDAETIMDTDSLVTLIDVADSTVHSFGREEARAWTPDLASESSGITFYLTATGLATDPPAGPMEATRLYVQNLSNESIVFRSRPLERSITIIGAEASFNARGTAGKWQANVLLWDHDPATPSWRAITRGTYEARDGGAERRVEYDLAPTLYTIPAGHILEARVKVGMPLLKPEDEFGQAAFAPQEGGFTAIVGSVESPAGIRLITPGSATNVRELERARARELDLTWRFNRE